MTLFKALYLFHKLVTFGGGCLAFWQAQGGVVTKKRPLGEDSKASGGSERWRISVGRHGSTTRCGLWSSMIMRESLFDCLDPLYHAISWYIILEVLPYSSIMYSNPCSRSLLTQPDRIWFVAGGQQMSLYSWFWQVQYMIYIIPYIRKWFHRALRQGPPAPDQRLDRLCSSHLHVVLGVPKSFVLQQLHLHKQEISVFSMCFCVKCKEHTGTVSRRFTSPPQKYWYLPNANSGQNTGIYTVNIS